MPHRIFSILPARLPAVDMLLPVFMEVKRQCRETEIEMIFVEPRAWDDLRRNPFLMAETDSVIDRITLLGRGRMPGRLLNDARAMACTLPVLNRMMRSPRHILLHTRGIISPYMRFMADVTHRVGGRVYEHFKSIVLTIDRTPKRRGFPVNEGDGFLCFGPHDVPFLRSQGYRNVIPIGYTRMYRAWLERIREVSDGLVREECRRLRLPQEGKIVSLFLPSTIPVYFDVNELDAWIKSVFRVLRGHVPEATVLIKAHPMQDMQALARTLEACGSLNYGLTELHPSVLADRSWLSITHHSTTTMDALAFGVPTIQYQEITDRWLSIHPEGSSYLRLGPYHARNEAELVQGVGQVLEGRFVMPDLVGILDHKEDVTPFLPA